MKLIHFDATCPDGDIDIWINPEKVIALTFGGIEGIDILKNVTRIHLDGLNQNYYDDFNAGYYDDFKGTVFIDEKREDIIRKLTEE
jgi:hypothetical protein